MFLLFFATSPVNRQMWVIIDNDMESTEYIFNLCFEHRENLAW
jgi:hypothetical protein